jgi:hypothetical protein
VGWPVCCDGGCGASHLQTHTGEGVGGRKPETKPLWLGSRSAVSNSGGRWLKGVVGWPVRRDGGRGVSCSQTHGGGGGWGLKA